MSGRTRSSARQAARPASTAPAANAAATTRTNRTTAPSSTQPDLVSEIRVSRRSASHDSEAEAGEPSRRGPAKKKQKQQQQSRKATAKSSRRNVEVPTIEEEDEGSADDNGETQGTIVLASAADDPEADEDAADAAGQDSDKDSETFTDAPEVPAGAGHVVRQLSPALSGTTARASDVRSELSASNMLKALPDLFYHAKAVIRILTNDPGESIPEDDLKADPRFRAYESAFAAFSLEEWISLADVQKLLNRPYKHPDQIPMRDRVDEPCFLANIAHLLHEINSSSIEGGLDFNTLYELDTNFPLHFETGLAKKATLNIEVGLSRLEDLTVEIAIDLRTQRYIKSIVHAYNEDNLTSSKTLLQTFFHLDETKPNFKKLRAWNTPGLQDSDIEGKLKTLLTERVTELDALVAPDESTDEAGYEALQQELESNFPAKDFERKLVRWAIGRAEEIKDAFEERWNGNANALQKRLQEGLRARHPLQEIDAPNTSQEENVRDREYPGTATEEPEAQVAHKKHTTKGTPGKQSTFDKNKAKKRRAFLDQQKNANTGRAAASRNAAASDRVEVTPAGPPGDDFTPIGDYEDEEELPNEAAHARNQTTVSQPELSEHGQHFSDLGSIARQERGDISPEAFQEDTRALSIRPQQARPVPSSSSPRKRRRVDDEQGADGSDSRKRQRNGEDHSIDRATVAPSHRQYTSGQDSDAADGQHRRDASDTGNEVTARATIANQGRAIMHSSKLGWTPEEDKLLLEGIDFYGGKHGCMTQILQEFDRHKTLQNRGRKNDALTDRARLLLFTKLSNKQEPSDSLCKTRLKPLQILKLQQMGVNISDYQ